MHNVFDTNIQILQLWVYSASNIPLRIQYPASARFSSKSRKRNDGLSAFFKDAYPLLTHSGLYVKKVVRLGSLGFVSRGLPGIVYLKIYFAFGIHLLFLFVLKNFVRIAPHPRNALKRARQALPRATVYIEYFNEVSGVSKKNKFINFPLK